MPTTLTPYAASDVFTASSLLTRVEQVEDLINGGIIQADLDLSSKWLRQKHVQRPDFYTSPVHRSAGASGTILWERTGNANEVAWLGSQFPVAESWVTVNGLSATVRVIPARSESTMQAIVLVGFYTFDRMGAEIDVEDSIACQFDLFVDDTSQGLDRWIYARVYYPSPDNVSVKYHVMQKPITLSRGIHDIGVKAYINTSASNLHEHIYVKARTMSIRTFAL